MRQIAIALGQLVALGVFFGFLATILVFWFVLLVKLLTWAV